MDITLKPVFSIPAVILLILIYLFGLPIVYGIIHFTDSDTYFNISLFDLLIANLGLTAKHIGGLIIGLGLFNSATPLKQDRWTWLLVGLLYGYYALLFITIVVIMQNIHSMDELIYPVQKIVVLLIIGFLASTVLPYSVKSYIPMRMDIINQGFVSMYTTLLTVIIYGVMAFINILLVFKLYIWNKTNAMPQNVIWMIAILLLGLFPLVLYNALLLMRKNER